jgi:histidyl-tRNA synthetase
MKIQPIRGTHDLYGEELHKFTKIEKVVKYYANIYGFNKIITPIFESTDLFKKPLGDQSDVVLKEMYTFLDRNKSSLTLRPEYTTPIIRAAISNNLLEKTPQKLFGIGPMFRRERPQKGRYRQFNQMNFEILGSNDEASDVDLILLAKNILQDLLPEKEIILQINSLGDKDTLGKFKESLKIYFDKYKFDLSDESKEKIDSNSLRILDSKDKKDIEINANAPKISNFYSEEAKKYFNIIQSLLDQSSLNFEINNTLVRGLDYYCHTVFEFKTKDLGSQDTLIGGGRYNGLVKMIGGKDISGVGWAGGIERIMMLMHDNQVEEKKVQLIIMKKELRDYGYKLLNLLRENKIPVHFDYKYNLKKSLSFANNSNYEYAIIVGENELNNNLCILKELKTGSQKSVSFIEIIKILKK